MYSENSKWGIRKTYQNGTDGVRNKKVLGYRYDGSISSPSPEKEWIFSFSNRTSTPISFKCLTVESRSTVFLANLDRQS